MWYNDLHMPLGPHGSRFQQGSLICYTPTVHIPSSFNIIQRIHHHVVRLKEGIRAVTSFCLWAYYEKINMTVDILILFSKLSLEA